MSTWQRIINDAITVPATQARTALPLLGNLLEWYDFAIYGYLAQALGDAFIPSESNSAALLSSFAVFAVGFLMRPIGSRMEPGIDEAMSAAAAAKGGK